jgi:hypothetical protein
VQQYVYDLPASSIGQIEICLYVIRYHHLYPLHNLYNLRQLLAFAPCHSIRPDRNGGSFNFVYSSTSYSVFGVTYDKPFPRPQTFLVCCRLVPLNPNSFLWDGTRLPEKKWRQEETGVNLHKVRHSPLQMNLLDFGFFHPHLSRWIVINEPEMFSTTSNISRSPGNSPPSIYSPTLPLPRLLFSPQRIWIFAQYYVSPCHLSRTLLYLCMLISIIVQVHLFI